jgi:outer membrane protein assembly factor BamB
MRRLVLVVTVCFGSAFALMVNANAQGRIGQEWMTSNGDAQRSSWVRTDPKISKESLQKPGFQFLWKLKLNNNPRHLNSLTPPPLLDLLIGYRGFRSLAFVGGSSDRVFVIDTDLGRMEWEKRLTTGSSSRAGIPPCPGGMTANLTRPTVAAIPPLPGGGGRGRGNPARSAVGEPGQGAAILAQLAAPPTPPPPRPPPRPGPPPPSPPGSNLFGSGPFLIYALSGDGMLHTMHLSNGEAYQPPIKFLPPNAHAYGLTVIDQVAYVVTRGGCDGTPNGVWALDLRTKKVTTWNASVVGLGGPAFGPDGTLYVTTGGSPQHSFSVVALAPGTLQVKDWYKAGDGFGSSPVVFEYKEKILIAATTQDGIVHLLDSTSLGGADHQTPLDRKPVQVKGSWITGSLSSWQSPDGTRWILAPVDGQPAPAAGFTAAGGPVTRGAIVTWKIAEKDGAPALEPGWISRDLGSPVPPTIINGVVFAVSGGEFGGGEFRGNANDDSAAPARIKRSLPAVLYALDALTGKELWNSGTTIKSFVRGDALSGGGGQFYLGTHDGTLYAFGFPMEH